MVAVTASPIPPAKPAPASKGKPGTSAKGKIGTPLAIGSAASSPAIGNTGAGALPAGSSTAPVAPSKFDAFPNYRSPEALKVGEQLAKLLQSGTNTTAPATGKAPAKGTATAPPAPLGSGVKAPKGASPGKKQPASTKPATKPATKPTGKTKRGVSQNPQFQIDMVRFAEYSRAAYQINSNAWNCPRCLDPKSQIYGTKVTHFFNKGAYGYVGYHEKNSEIVVAFRGTSNVKEMLDDLKAIPVPWKKGPSGAKVHMKFNDYYQGVAASVDKAIMDAWKYLGGKAKRIVITGHSLGGSLASLSTHSFAHDHPDLVSKLMLITYGQPRTGNKEYAQWLDSQQFPKYRFTYRTDPVPKLPPALGYIHHGQEFYIPLSGSIVECAPAGESNDKCINKAPISTSSIADHSGYPGLEKIEPKK
ncbi:hypothetical protein GGI12_002494 [Dipsacomyces acuminosporus]|nr:hypothetical protein GGI12_002494 [Dipsacomyces acuminosporus]